jgi:hypothetical protein
MLQHLAARGEEGGARGDRLAELQKIILISAGPVQKQDRRGIGRCRGLEAVSKTE